MTIDSSLPVFHALKIRYALIIAGIHPTVLDAATIPTKPQPQIPNHGKGSRWLLLCFTYILSMKRTYVICKTMRMPPNCESVKNPQFANSYSEVYDSISTRPIPADSSQCEFTMNNATGESMSGQTWRCLTHRTVTRESIEISSNPPELSRHARRIRPNIAHASAIGESASSSIPRLVINALT